jgi:hypothetical protein
MLLAASTAKHVRSSARSDRAARQANWITDCAACPGPCGSPAPRPRPGPSRQHRSHACGRTPVREGSGRPPTAPPTPRDRRPPRAALAQHLCRGWLHAHRGHTAVSPTAPRRPRAALTWRSRPACHPALRPPRGFAIALVGQRGSPEPLPSSQEIRVIEHRVRHESPIRLLPAPHIHARHPRDVFDLSRADGQRGTHGRIVGRQPPAAASA